MKRLFSVLMVAAIATFTFAFTTPKAFEFQPYHLVGSTWVSGEGDNCTGDSDPCQISIDDADLSTYKNVVINAVLTDGRTGAFTLEDFDHDGNSGTPAIDIDVEYLLKN